MTEGTVRLGIIGAGWWGQEVHARGVLSHPQAELVALCSRTEAKLRRAGEALGVSALYMEFQDLLDHDGLDAVTIATTHDLHYPIAQAALERGLHVFCEKPLGLNSRETARLAALAKERRVVNMVAFTNRWVPEAAHAKQLLDHGFCGTVFHVTACKSAGYGGPGSSFMWRTDPARSGGGVLFDLGCHVLDLCQWLVSPIRAVCADVQTTVPSRRGDDGEAIPTAVDDAVACLVAFETGPRGVVHVSWTASGPGYDRTEIAGSEASLRLGLNADAWVNALTVCPRGSSDPHPVSPSDALQGRIPRDASTPEQREAAQRAFIEDHPSLVRAFIGAIVGEGASCPSFADGHRTQQVMDAILLSSRERRWVEVAEVSHA